ncbi:hypothetical protein J1TS5_26070 [Paenibacillus macerans]|nr:hypothetical protein J1TS5_26070 [Paenibacillus macerans]
MHCRMPGCTRLASKHWQLVEVCANHFSALQKEAHKFYDYKIKESDRVLYQQIQKIKERQGQ